MEELIIVKKRSTLYRSQTKVGLGNWRPRKPEGMRASHKFKFEILGDNTSIHPTRIQQEVALPQLQPSFKWGQSHV